MWLYKQSSTTARTALIYITLGALIVIWAGVWYVDLYNNPAETSTAYYWCAGFMVTGLMLVLIGAAVGRIGQSTQLTALPPAAVPIAAMTAPTLAMAPPPVLTAPNQNGFLVAPDGQIVGAAPQPR
jgi:hypothetical protein